MEPATDELFGVKQSFGGGGEIWKMDGGTRVVSACFGFEGATSMEIPFAADKLEEALLWFDHGFREEEGGLGIMLDPRKGED